MNANQIMNMIMRMFMRRVISRGMDMGFDALSKRSPRGGKHPMPDDMPPQSRQQGGPWEQQGQAPEAHPDMAAADSRQKHQARQAAKQARDAMKVTRRLNRF